MLFHRNGTCKGQAHQHQNASLHWTWEYWLFSNPGVLTLTIIVGMVISNSAALSFYFSHGPHVYWLQ